MVQDFQLTDQKQMSLFDSYKFGGLLKLQLFTSTADVIPSVPQIYFEESNFTNVKYGYRRYYNKSDSTIDKPL